MKNNIDGLSTAIEKHLRVTTMPVAIKLVKEAGTPHQKQNTLLKSLATRSLCVRE